jgi:hypothetical protein
MSGNRVSHTPLIAVQFVNQHSGQFAGAPALQIIGIVDGDVQPHLNASSLCL